MVKEKQFRETEWKEFRLHCLDQGFEPSDFELALIIMLANICKPCPVEDCRYYAYMKQRVTKHVESHHPDEHVQISGSNIGRIIAIVKVSASKIKQERMGEEQQDVTCSRLPEHVPTVFQRRPSWTATAGPVGLFSMSGDAGRRVGSPTLTHAGGGWSLHQYDNDGGMGVPSTGHNLMLYPFSSSATPGAFLQQTSTQPASFSYSGNPVSMDSQGTEPSSYDAWRQQEDETD